MPTKTTERSRALHAQALRRQDDAISFLEQLTRIETPSDDPAAQGPALTMIAGAFGALGMRCRQYRGRRSGGTLIARWPADRGAPIQLLVGHCDTVWPAGTLATMPLQRRGPLLHGPGVFDMKAGITQMLFALTVLRDLGLEPEVRPVVLINSDEEVGTRDTHATLARLARLADRAFILEPSLAPDGRLKTARKGVAQYRVTIRGKAAHAGLNPEQGVSAIVEMARVIKQLEALDAPTEGVTINVGTVRGGTRPNVVAQECVAEVDVRVPAHEAARRVDRAIRSMRPRLAGATLDIEGTEGRPPMEFTRGGRRLWEAARAHASDLGFGLEHGTAGGGSDGNITSQYTPTLDGLGAVGDGAHSAHEHVDLRRMPERTALLAALLLEPARQTD